VGHECSEASPRCKDFFQLVTDRIRSYRPSKGADAEVIGHQGSTEVLASPEQVIDVLALIGDSSDNIPLQGDHGEDRDPADPAIRNARQPYQHIDEIPKAGAKEKLMEGSRQRSCRARPS